MSRTDNLKNDVIKAKEIRLIKAMRGWAYIEEFVAIEEGKLNNSLFRAPAEKLDRIRGGLEFIKKFKVFLQMSALNGSDAAKELERYLSQI